MADDPYKYFRLEAREILDRFGTAVLELEKDGGGAQVPLLLRLAHTLKGAARVVKQSEIANGAHAIEETLDPYRATANALPRDRVDAVLQHLDVIARRVGGLGSPEIREVTPAAGLDTAPPSRPADDEVVRTVRADIAELDLLLENIAETHALVSGLRSTLQTVEQVQRLADLVAEQLAPRRDGTLAPQLSAASRAYALADDLRRGVSRIERDLDTAIDQIDRELRQSREAAEELRLVGTATLFGVLERTARDTARELGKQVVFEAGDNEIRLDADILAAIQPALVQLVRNAVAHGIESPADRRAAGKQSSGKIALDISRRGGRLLFGCRDDGRGVDLEAVRRAAQRRGITPGEIARMGAGDLVHLLLQGGLTTVDSVTEIAGRGIGLDIVRATVERLGGTVSVDTEQGKGTGFELSVPLSLASIDALIIEAGGTEAAIPLDAVRTTLLFGTEAVSRAATGEVSVLYDERAIPFLWLPQVLTRRPLAVRKWPTVIIATPDGSVAVGVDFLRGLARTVVRPLPELAPAGAVIAGAALDAEGNPRLVLNPDGLLAEALRGAATEPEQRRVRHPVLIVDDSLTTRMLEQSILESAGYEVDLATSAEEGLEMALRRRYALFLVDVEMPGMDGFGFVARARADPALHDIPAVLVTSRAAPEDRQRGRNAGARGYIVKGKFDQAELLELIRNLIG
jgi:two-component system, chemotaxis family, sensor kinase CheA